jgi:transposase
MSMNEIMDTMATERRRTRRNHSAQLKAQVLTECSLPGASVAKVAMAHGINANIVHGWRRLAREGSVAEAAAFVPVAIATSPPPQVDERIVEIELHRGALSMKIRWPLTASRELQAWTRELLR